MIYEKSKEGYSAYVPDLPGCTSAGKSKQEIKTNITEAIRLYLEVLKEEGESIPHTKSESEIVTVS